ncbi:MAG: glycosyltransferase family 39 protein [Roseiflexaceae bacterium]|nr:glycosyltransferase family 39 protein [Roseiflexaceae bacterium]
MSGETGARASPALRLAIRAIAAALASMLLVTLLCQIPATHRVDVGRFDAGYVRGFYDPERLDLPQARAYLNGSDGSARWTRVESHLLFPQAGLPAEMMLRLRGWRADGPPPQITILVDGREAYSGATASEWQEIRLVVQQPSLKPEDVLITLRADVAPIGSGDPRLAGVLVDAAEYRTGGPLLQPYPAQLAWGALAGALLALALADTQWGERKPWLRFFTPLRVWIAGMLLIGLAWLLLYRLQPAYPYPLRGLLPGICAALGAATVLRYGPALAARLPALPDVLALGGIAAWTAAILLAAQDHVTLSVPGVEKDFRVFATRAVDLALILRADGFYNLGYPFLLWCVAPLTGGNVFLAARLVAAFAGMIFLGASWVLARRALGRTAALAALVMLALNPFVVQYALYIGSDMPFAAFCALTLALLAQWTDRKNAWLLVLAGVAAGFAFLVRHPGILLLPFGVLGILWTRQEARGERQEARGKRREVSGERREARGERREANIEPSTFNLQPSTFNLQPSTFNVLAFVLAFFIAIAPQAIVNVRDTGNPFYNQQAKNIWLAVYGDSDWGRWNEVSNDIPLTDVILEDPARFAGAWWSNLRAFIGAGAESTGDAGQASQLRLLAFPANWLAVAGLVGWLALIGIRHMNVGWVPTPVPSFAVPLLVWIGLYAAALAVGLPLQRFYLPLAPVYAIAAAWTLALAISALAAWRSWSPVRLWIMGVLVFLVLLWQGFALGVREVIDRQPADEVAAIRLVQQTVPPGEMLRTVLAPGDPVSKYSAIAHRIAPPERETRYLLHSSEAGPRPDGAVIATFGKYALVQVQP